MHNWKQRLSLLFSFACTVSGFVGGFLAIVSLLWQPILVDSNVILESVRVEHSTQALRRQFQSYYYTPSHYIVLHSNVTADFTEIMSYWNTKLVQAQLVLKFEDQKEIIWDKLILQKKDAKLSFSSVNKYAAHGQDHRDHRTVCGKQATLELNWSISPQIGWIRFIQDQKQIKFTIPELK